MARLEHSVTVLKKAHLIFILIICQVIAASELNPLSDAFIALINKEGKWKAGRNFHPDTPMKYIKGLLGLKLQDFDFKTLPTVENDKKLIKDLPETFDPREKWPNCPSLNEIRDQGRCGSCWAFGATSAMTDRVCIYSNGTQNFHFSAEDLTTCIENGCHGGSPYAAWRYWVDHGLVSGGNYGSHQGCRPYSTPPCANHMTNCTDYLTTPRCVRSCIDGYKISYEKDLRKGKSFYTVEGVDNMMAELFKNGPVEAAFDVYEDFANYKSGVYQHVHGKNLNSHAIKIMGWGVEDGKKYWLIANSWGTGFGDKGYFKILRGVNECNIEKYPVVAGEPLL